MADATLITAFGAGALSFFSPCVLPLVPAYLSIVSGVSVNDVRTGGVPDGSAASDPVAVGVGAVTEAGTDALAGGGRPDAPAPRAAPPSTPGWRMTTTRLRVVRGTALFMLGFTVVFVLLGASASALGGFLLEHRLWFQRVSGVLVIAFGIFLAGFITPDFMERERRFRASSNLGSWGAPLMGAAFAFGWTPCIGPILGSILTLAGTSGEIERGVTLLFAYSLGLGIPFLISGLALTELQGLFGWVKRHFVLLNRFAGTILVAFGVLLFTDNVSWLSAQITRILDALGLDFLLTI